jgi:hypothetical protein
MKRLGMLLGTAAVVGGLLAQSAAAAPHPTEVLLRPQRNGFETTLLESKKECEGNSTFGRISVSNSAWKMVISTPNICTNIGWSREGHIPGGFQPSGTFYSGRGVVMDVLANGDNGTAEYRVVATTKDRRVTGWLTINRQRFWHYERVFEGTDAFVNYCIDQSQEIRSAGGRLYCAHESRVTGPSFVAFHRRPWHRY